MEVGYVSKSLSSDPHNKRRLFITSREDLEIAHVVFSRQVLN
ncbi:unnamed protein product [Spirodela intermedia]|uniref:Uncharacterized protein n=1 Tax=Spirodela intermedia TaxID=51605 RepID=A0A7I8JS66_SPIIN|nr:unnamed protein product [Spirodela intermedia]CAA6672601.1 unnamed protein product [Spirodela intermedia]